MTDLKSKLAEAEIRLEAYFQGLQDKESELLPKIERLTAEVTRRDKQINELKSAIGDAICNLDDVDGTSGTSYDLENALRGGAPDSHTHNWQIDPHKVDWMICTGCNAGLPPSVSDKGQSND